MLILPSLPPPDFRGLGGVHLPAQIMLPNSQREEETTSRDGEEKVPHSAQPPRICIPRHSPLCRLQRLDKAHRGSGRVAGNSIEDFVREAAARKVVRLGLHRVLEYN